MITTIRDAEAAVGFWRRRARGLEAALPAVAIKGDGVEVDRHLFELQAALNCHRRALEELATARGRPLARPVYLNAPAKADQRVPVISTAEFRRIVQMERVGIKPTLRRFVWRPASEREATELLRLFNIPATKSAGSRVRGFAVERLR